MRALLPEAMSYLSFGKSCYLPRRDHLMLATHTELRLRARCFVVNPLSERSKGRSDPFLRDFKRPKEGCLRIRSPPTVDRRLVVVSPGVSLGQYQALEPVDLQGQRKTEFVV